MGYEAELLSQININCKEFPPYAPLSDYNVFHILGISAKEVIMCRGKRKAYLVNREPENIGRNTSEWERRCNLNIGWKSEKQ